MSYLKDREIWLSSVPTGNPPAGYVWVFIQNGVFVVRDSSGVDKIMATTTGTVTNATSASYVEYSNVANKPALISGSSQVSYTGLSDIPAGIVSSSVQIGEYGVFATTGSNQFNGSQAITGSLTVTGQVVAQTLNVQQVTSSIVYSSGSNIFGNSLSNTQQFTGSLQVSGSSHYLLGNVGIGTDSPKSYATLTNTGQLVSLSNIGVDVGQAYKLNSYYSIAGGSDRTISTGFAASIGLDNSVGALTFSVSSLSVTADNNIVSTERMRITSGGNVGINTTNPNARLQVGDGTQAGINGAGNKIHIASNTSGGRSALLTLANSSGGTTVEGQFESSAESADLRIIIGSTSNHDVVFRTNNTEKMRIASGGLVTLTGALSGSSATFSSIIKSGGTSTQFLKADGSVDSTTYASGNFYAIDYLVVAGGGGGGGSERSNGFGGGGAGGGAGGLLVSTTSITSGSSYTIVVGAGGAGGVSRDGGEGSGLPGANGGYSQIFDTITIGGGQGQGDENGTPTASTGGSGGGRGGDSGTNAGSGTLGQGNGGGNNAGRCGGGGGGATTSGGMAIDGFSGGVGGNGIIWFDGSTYSTGGGGGGGAAVTNNAAGGNASILGGIGSRSTGNSSGGQPGGQATPGAANTGAGGGGAGAGYDQGGQNGGSGIVIIRYAGAQRGTGGTVTTTGGYTYHRFFSSGTFTA
jgi:hypothetical protein